ncbi:hypothetical protein CGZ80_24800 [Rhodopirellula sp. MGV]|nr:hypothetical protein CGZ80_24800 [Rhodopirellula sp. MGV]PNY35733.1 hypothetical protein C2E31_16755 [Rhodopirellula baltica]
MTWKGRCGGNTRRFSARKTVGFRLETPCFAKIRGLKKSSYWPLPVELTPSEVRQFFLTDGYEREKTEAFDL